MRWSFMFITLCRKAGPGVTLSGVTSKLLAKHDLNVWALGARGCCLGQHLHLYGGSFQPGGSEEELAGVCDRSGVSRDHQIRAGEQAGGKSRCDLHASDGFLGHEVVPGTPGLAVFETWVSRNPVRQQPVHNSLLVFTLDSHIRSPVQLCLRPNWSFSGSGETLRRR